MPVKCPAMSMPLQPICCLSLSVLTCEDQAVTIKDYTQP